jgi:uncharacterized membrane protein (UPF0182 family)
MARLKHLFYTHGYGLVMTEKKIRSSLKYAEAIAFINKEVNAKPPVP